MMSESHGCRAHVLNTLVQQFSIALKATKIINNYSRWLCQLLTLRRTSRDQYEAMVSERLLHIITINSQAASEAFDIIDTISTIQAQL